MTVEKFGDGYGDRIFVHDARSGWREGYGGTGGAGGEGALGDWTAGVDAGGFWGPV